VGWKAISRSEVGTSHRQENIPCQDYGDYRLFGDVIVGVVADGAGSAKYSHVGSELAVNTVIDLIARNFYKSEQKKLSPIEFARNFHKSEQEKLSPPLREEESKQMFTEIVQEIIAQLGKTAKQNNCDIKDLACTLLIFIATPEWLVAMQIGDGLMVVRPQNSPDYQLLFKPHKGEFVNETTFVTCSHALEEMQVKVIPSPEFIAAATDGLENVAITLKNCQPFPGFFQPLETYLQSTTDPNQEDEYLVNFLQSEALNKRTSDDKTVLLSIWQSSEVVYPP
jgi:serine/threonine protein phosphatase PrpC